MVSLFEALVAHFESELPDVLLRSGINDPNQSLPRCVINNASGQISYLMKMGGSAHEYLQSKVIDFVLYDVDTTNLLTLQGQLEASFNLVDLDLNADELVHFKLINSFGPMPDDLTSAGKSLFKTISSFEVEVQRTV
jgi:hypothetical protein